MIKSKFTFIFALLSLAVGFVACNLATSEQQLSQHARTVQNNVIASISSNNIDGNIRFFLTDAPLDDVKEVNITVTELRIKKHVVEATDDTNGAPQTDEAATDENEADEVADESTADETESESDDGEDSGWETITFDPARVIDLKKLSEGLTDVLGDLNLPTGIYKEIRLHVTQSEVVLNDGTKETLKIPSGGSSGLKIKFKGEGVTIETGKKYALVLDFDLEKSLIRKADKSSGHSHSSDEAGESDESADQSTSDESSDETSSGDDSSTETTDEELSENDSVEGTIWILKPVIRVAYLAEIDETTDTATVILTDEGSGQ